MKFPNRLLTVFVRTIIRPLITSCIIISMFVMSGCGDDDNDGGVEVSISAVYELALGCYSIELQDTPGSQPFYLTSDGTRFLAESTNPTEASVFFLKPSALATFLLYDRGEHYLVANDVGQLEREADLLSDIMLIQDDFLPGAQWVVEPSVLDPSAFQMRHLKSGDYLARQGLTQLPEGAAIIQFTPAQNCVDHPELTLDASGSVTRTTWEDGSVYGFAEPHTHMFTNFGFGGGGIFHGSPYHPLGVEHALMSCEIFHGPEGRRDFLGLGVGERSDISLLINALLAGEASEPLHNTSGYPEFTDWPNAPEDQTHQVQYYKWVERAYLGGLRLMVQHGTSHQVLCDLIAGSGIQEVRYECDDVVAIDRIIAETRKLEAYIDAHAGGPGLGWFRIVESPAEARTVIMEGKMAVVLGIEVSDLFGCKLNPKDGTPRCDEDDVIAALDKYYELGIRVLFPNHKTDNIFTPGDGDRGIFELANFVHTGNYSNYTTEDCNKPGVVFDKGPLDFANLNQPRDDYLAPPAEDLTDFESNPIGTTIRFLQFILPVRAEGQYCQNAGLTQLGEFLINELMRRGMIIEIDHLPQKSYERAFQMLTDNNYPAIGTHGRNNDGKLYELGGIATSRFDRCSSMDRPRDESRRNRIAQIEAAGGYPSEPWSFDLNGLAGAPRGRFDPDRPCSFPQENPVSYPFESYAGDVTFTRPKVGNRTLDFNTEGFVHLGLLPEMVEDLRKDGVGQEALDALFKSAEAYLRMWELSERRGQEIREATL